MNLLQNVDNLSDVKELLSKKKADGKIDDNTYNQILSSMESPQSIESQKAINYVAEALMNDVINDNDEIILNSNSSKPKINRTKTKSKADELEYPNNLAVPTISKYQYAMSVLPKGNAYIQADINMSSLKCKNGKLFFADSSGVMQRISEVELQNFKTKERVEIDKLSLPLLRAYYSVLLHNYSSAIATKTPLPKVVKLYVPDLLEYIGLKRNSDRKTIDSIINQMSAFHNVIGVMHVFRNGNPDKSYFPVLNFEGYNVKTNTMEISSPYLFHIIETIYKASIIIDKKTQKPKLKKNGEIMTIPSHSYLIKSDISSEKNLAAIENVFIIVTIIEQAGNNVPHIKVSSLIERNPQLQQRLEKTDKAHKSRLLQRVFKRTWELLREQTRLMEIYKNIKLPDPDDKDSIPTMRKLEMVLEFPHEGKKEKSDIDDGKTGGTDNKNKK